MTFSEDMRAIAATLPDAAWDALVAAAKVELQAVQAVDDTVCLQNLLTAAIQRAIYDDQKARADAATTALNNQAATLQSQIVTLTAQVAALQAQYDDLIDNPGPTGTPVATLIANGRATLVANRHHLLPNSIDWKGNVDVTAAVVAFIAATPNGVSDAARRTVDLWAGGTYLMDGKCRLNGKRYTTVDMHGATTKPKPPLYLGICTVDGRTPFTGSYSHTAGTAGSTARRTITGSGFPASGWIGARVESRPTGGSVGIPAGARVVSQTTTTVVIDMDVTATKTNQPLYVDDRSRHVSSDGTGYGAFTTAALKGRNFILHKPWGTIPDEITIDFAVDATHFDLLLSANFDATAEAYAVSGGLPVNGVYPRARNRVHWTFDNCFHVRITNGTILGAMPATWNRPGTTLPEYVSDLEGQAAIQIAGGDTVEADHLTIRNVWGDFCYASSLGGINSRNVWFHDNDCDRAGRQGMSPVQTDNFRANNNKLHHMGRSVIDIELLLPSWHCDGIEIDHNEVGLSLNNFIAAVCDGTRCSNVRIHHNTLIGRPLSMLIEARAYVRGVPSAKPPIARGIPANQWVNWSITDNDGATSSGGGGSIDAVMNIKGITGFTLARNSQSFRLSAASPPAPYMVLAECTDIGAYTVADNELVNARVRPGGGYYEAQINGVFVPAVASPPAKAGLPATGCMIGAVCSGQTGTPAPHNQGSLIARMAALETSLGRTVDVHRLFVDAASGYNVDTRDAELRDDKAAGRVSVLSMKIPSGQTWVTMQTSPLLQAAANRLKFYTETVGCKIVFLVEHEIDRPTVQHGTPANYSALVTQQFTKIRATAPLVTTCVQTSYFRLYWNTTHPGTSQALTPAQVKAYFPADLTLMDLYGTDVYNDPVDAAKRSIPFSELVQPHYDLALSINKDLGIHEIGCALIADACSTNGQPAPNPNRNAWVQGVYDYAATHPRLKHISWYHSNNNAISPADPDAAAGTDWLHDWWVDDTAPLKAVHVAEMVATGGPHGNYFRRFGN